MIRLENSGDSRLDRAVPNAALIGPCALLGGKPAFETPLSLVRPRFPELDLFKDAFSAALRNGVVTNHGPHVQVFENALRGFIGGHVATCNSGHAALALMLRAANIIDGEVILPSYTFASTPHAVRWCGATPVFADIELSTFCLDADSVVRAITPKTRAILAVDLYGIVSPYARLKELAASHKLKLLVDSAPAFGAREYGKNIGVQADAHSFSFHATKAFSTMEGGAVSSTCEELVSRVALLRNFGQMTDGDCLEPGWNAKMMEVCAIIGSLQLERFEETLVVRRALAARYLAYFSHHKYFETVDVPSFQEPAWLYFPVLIRDNAGLSRDDFVRALNDENIYCRTYFHRPCHRMTVYDRGATESLVITEYVAQRVVCFPLFNDMTAGELDLILAAVDRIIEQISEIRAGE